MGVEGAWLGEKFWEKMVGCKSFFSGKIIEYSGITINAYSPVSHKL